MAWTAQQENAINARNSSIIVSAAAGSGKTSVLTERLVRLLADPASGVRADRMIVVTFTNDAASSLKERLDKKLREKINEDPTDSHLLEQQILLQNAKISTINSFCFELIRDNIDDQGITSGFSILDEAENDVIMAQAMDELLEYYSENEYDDISLIYDRFCIKNENALISAIKRANSFLSSVALRDEWLSDAENEYKKDFKETKYYTALMASLKERADKITELAESCLEMVYKIFPDTEGFPQAKKSLELAEEELEKAESLAALYRSGNFPTEDEAAQLCTFRTLVRVTDKTPHNSSLRDIYKKKRDDLKERMKSLASSTVSIESDFAESAEVTFILTKMLRKYNELIWQKKCEKNAISFDDGERLALKLLYDLDENGQIVQSEIARLTSEYYDLIMIDEYQDSNNKQDLIFKLLSKNYKNTADGEPMYGDNAFVVGDVKQSIYRFRLANPKNFNNTLRNSVEYTPEGTSPNKAVFLNKNFRSSRGVIDFVNFVFGQIMTERCGDKDYDEKEMLYFGAEKYDEFELPYKTHISFIDDTPPEDDSVSPAEFSTKTEAAFTARKIASMINSGVKVPDEDSGELRPCKPSDFSILVRGNKYINVYADELEKLGIPARHVEEAGYLRSREIAILIDLLRVINNPLLDIPMMAVMTSPMYMFTVQELALIKSLSREKQLYPLLLGVAGGEYDSLIGTELAERCRSFLEDMDHFRLKAVTLTIGELIDAVYDNTDFISVMQLAKDGEKKRANLRLLIQYAKAFESSSAYEGTGGLCSFLRYIDRVMENGDLSQGKTSASSGEYVSVQTLHGSKGLEFPFVFIAETSHRFQYDSYDVMCSDDGRIGYILYDPKLVRHYRTFQQIMLAEEKKRDTRSEEMRLLYVGMTRAKQQLFINLKAGEKALKHVGSLIDEVRCSDGDISGVVCEADMFSDWIWAAILRHKDAAEVSEMLSEELPQAVFEDDLFELEFAENETEDAQLTDDEEEQVFLPDEDVCRELFAIMNDKYDRTLSQMTSKLSVTQMTRKFEEEGKEFDFKLKRPKFISAKSGLSGKEKGTAIHTFFQYCTFEKAKEDIESEIDRMIDMGYLTTTQADSIDRKKSAAFFESRLYSRLAAASGVWREKKFMVAASHLNIDTLLMEQLKKSDGMIKGIIDLMFEEEDGIVLVDYKSDRLASEEELAEKYGIQLRLYCSAIELTMKKKVKEAFLYSIELEKEIPIKL